MARDEIYPEAGLVIKIRALSASLPNKAGHRGSDRQPLGNRSGDKIEEAYVCRLQYTMESPAMLQEIVTAVGKLKEADDVGCGMWCCGEGFISQVLNRCKAKASRASASFSL